jgi:cell filamentation protein
MASKYQLKNSSIYIEGTDVPKNKLYITSSEEIHELERELLTEAYTLFYEELNEHTNFDESYFKALHRRTFEALYEWAGEYRDFNMAKGNSRFCQGAFVESESRKIFEQIKEDNYLKDLEKITKEDFARKISHYKCELVALHPFYELNGRITRLFFDMVAAYNGYKYIDYSNITPEAYIEASMECVQFADCSKLETIIYNGLSR